MTFEEAAEQLTAASEQVEAIPVREMRRLARTGRARVLGDWPVESGESRRGFTVVDAPDGALLFNRVRHAFFVGDGQAHATIQKTMRQQQMPTITRIERDVTELLEG